MLALQKVRPGSGIELRHLLEISEILPGEVLTRTEATGICGTDLHIAEWTSGYEAIQPAIPVTLGREMSGTIVSTGTAVDRSFFGTRVTVRPSVVCGKWTRAARKTKKTARAAAVSAADTTAPLPLMSRYPLPIAWCCPKGSTSKSPLWRSRRRSALKRRRGAPVLHALRDGVAPSARKRGLSRVRQRTDMLVGEDAPLRQRFSQISLPPRGSRRQRVRGGSDFVLPLPTLGTRWKISRLCRRSINVRFPGCRQGPQFGTTFALADAKVDPKEDPHSSNQNDGFAPFPHIRCSSPKLTFTYGSD